MIEVQREIQMTVETTDLHAEKAEGTLVEMRAVVIVEKSINLGEVTVGYL